MIKSFICFLLVGGLMANTSFKVVEDNMDFEIDKRAHLGVSFGLYYTAYTLLDSSQSAAMLSATAVGLGYEVYQGYRWKQHEGFSKEDMIYNIAGIALANITHKIILYIRKII